MTLYNVHIYREMRLLFTEIEAESPETAAAIAGDKLTSEAAEIDECDGRTFAATRNHANDRADTGRGANFRRIVFGGIASFDTTFGINCGLFCAHRRDFDEFSREWRSAVVS